jgi:hypothetical protein
MGLMSDNYDGYGNMGGMDDEPYRPGLMQSAKNWMSQDKNKHALMQMVQAIGQPINGTRGATSSQNTLGIISNMLGAYNQSNMGGYDQYKQQQEMQKLKTDDLRTQVDLRKANLAQMNAPAAPKSALDYMSKIDFEKATPESIAAFGQSLNPADLRARSKVDIAPSGEVYDPYNQSALGKNMGALKDFDMGQTRLFTRPDGTPVANLPMSQSPNSKASNALGWANFGLSKQRAAQEGQGQLVETADGYVRVGRDNIATPIMSQGAPLIGKGAKLTEDQGKATGWLSQAENAYSNMKQAIKENPSALRPGFGDAIGNIPGFGAVGRSAMSPERQKFNHSTSSMGEAFLRAATGAGVNKDEAKQKLEELTPLFGDKQEVIDQKLAAIPVYLDSLKVRAGGKPSRRATDNASKGGFKILSVD